MLVGPRVARSRERYVELHGDKVDRFLADQPLAGLRDADFCRERQPLRRYCLSGAKASGSPKSGLDKAALRSSARRSRKAFAIGPSSFEGTSSRIRHLQESPLDHRDNVLQRLAIRPPLLRSAPRPKPSSSEGRARISARRMKANGLPTIPGITTCCCSPSAALNV